MSDLVTWANGDGTFSYVPESQIPAMMQQDATATASPSQLEGLELIDILFLGIMIILTIAFWKEPLGYFFLGFLVAKVLIDLVM